MGDPKKHRKKYSNPRIGWQKERIEKELNLVGKYGLRNKKEIWRLQAVLSKFRGRARKLLSLTDEEMRIGLKELNNRLNRMGLLPETAKIDDILRLSIEDLLERRLQTMVYNKGLANSVYHSRQLITHAHITVGGRKITSPGHLVLRNEENFIDYALNSPYSDLNHPSRVQPK